MSKTGRTILKIALSLFLIYHCAAVVILPNGSSMIGRRVSWFFLPYANPVIFNRTWQFFSPGPMSAIYLEYNLITNAGPEADEARAPLQYPPKRTPGEVNDFYTRTLAGTRLLAANPETFEQYFIPFLCRMNPEAISLDLHSIVAELPPIEKADPAGSFKDMQEETNLPRKIYQCPGRELTPSQGDSHG